MAKNVRKLELKMGSTPIPSTTFEDGSSGPVFFVYVLQSQSTHRFYIGHCDHLLERFHEHQAGYSKATRKRGPWWMPYFESYPTRALAMRRERELKAMKSHRRIQSLILRKCPDLEVP